MTIRAFHTQKHHSYETTSENELLVHELMIQKKEEMKVTNISMVSTAIKTSEVDNGTDKRHEVNRTLDIEVSKSIRFIPDHLEFDCHEGITIIELISKPFKSYLAVNANT